MQTEATPLIEAKQEYISQLQQLIDKAVYGKFFEFFIQTVERTEDPMQILVNFQNEMENIRTWNAEQVDTTTQAVIADPEFFSQLLTAVLILKTKIMTAFKIDSSHKNVQLKVPSNEHFVHHLFTVAGHHLYNNPWVFVTDESKSINTQRYRDCLNIIHQAIDETITHFVPVRNILKEYIGVKEPVGIETPEVPPVVAEPPEAKAPTEVKKFDEEGKFLGSEILPDPANPTVESQAPAPVPVPGPAPYGAPVVPPPPVPPSNVHDTSDVQDSEVAEGTGSSGIPPFEKIGETPTPTVDLPRPAPQEGYQAPETFDSDEDSDDSEYEYEPSEQDLRRSDVQQSQRQGPPDHLTQRSFQQIQQNPQTRPLM